VIAAAHPFDWHLHLAWLLALAGLVGSYIRATQHGGGGDGGGATRRQHLLFGGGVVLLAGAVTWPLGDLASHWLLLALVLQRLLLTLAVPPLLVLGTPRPLIARLTRSAAVDAVLRVVVRPLPAVAIVTVVAVSTLTVGAVHVAAQSVLALGAVELVVLASGFVLWAPVLTELPGAPRLSALGRGGYLIVQSIVPSFLSIVWIFARHPLYPTFTYRGTVVGMTPLLDQELAGFLAKLSTIAVLWTVAFVIMTRAQSAETAGRDADPLVWSDVEREIERADRRDRRQGSPRPPPPGSF
jgi:cytochrome c oxidase assembly factor CtaG